MKCPKCGYLGFETTDRCRNCGYDFSLAPFSSEPELPLRDTNKDQTADFDLPNISKPVDSMTPSSLDLDRLFGTETPAAPAPPPMASLSLESPVVAAPIAPLPRMRASSSFIPSSAKFPKPTPEVEMELMDKRAPLPEQIMSPVLPQRPRLPNTQVMDMPKPVQEEPDYTINVADVEIPMDLSKIPTAKPTFNTPAPEELAIEPPTPAAPPPAPVMAAAVVEPVEPKPAEPEPVERVAPVEPVEPAVSVDVLPFVSAPIAPPPARPPLAVRRSTPEVVRGRRNTPRPARTEPTLGLEPEKPAVSTAFRSVTSIPAPSTAEPPALGARVFADLIDVLLLASIDAAVLVLTLRITGLTMVWDDLRVVPAVPFVGFLALLAFGYVAAFTVAGGQTIGKMLMGIRVIGDDGHAVDAAGGVLRALGCALVPLTLGLSYIPVLVTSDRRALHDRLAGTRVVAR